LDDLARARCVFPGHGTRTVDFLKQYVVAPEIGQMLQDELGVRAPLVCVDQIALSDLDFIDIGAVVPDKAVVPVVIKSLVFSEPR
jgi:ethanolamine utilization protein EutA (predicted chaperonin)